MQMQINPLNGPMDEVMEGVEEFVYNLIQTICKFVYDGLYESSELIFNGMFDSLNGKIASLSTELIQSPKEWNASAFAVAKGVADNACIPIAGFIISFVFCWELIHLTKESNQMQNIKPDTIMIKLLELGLCLLVCSNSFDIVMGFFDIGAYATEKLSGTSIGKIGEGLIFSKLFERKTSDFTALDMIQMLMNYFILLITRFSVMVCGIIIYVRVMLWFVELLIYASAAPIPFATFGNKEWSQVGMNYSRKMLAVCFEGFFMLLIFALYGGVLTGAYAKGGGDFTEGMFMVIGCSIAFVMLLFKAGSISSSIFNAH